MSFSYSNGLITQTGTDTDLTGLSGLTGVTTQVSGTGTAQHTTYFLNSSTGLWISGTLSFDPNVEKVSLSFPAATSGSGAHPLTISGSLTIEGATTVSGRTQYSRMTGIDLTAPSSIWWRDHGIAVTSTGSFTMNGGALRLGSGIRGNATCTIFFQNCVIYASASNSGTVFRAGDNSPVLRNVEIASRVNSEVFISAKQGFSEASLILRNAMYYTETNQSTSVTFTDYDVSANIASADINFENQYAMCQVIFNNTSNRLRVRQQSPNRGGYAKCFKTFNVPIQDLDGNSIDYSYYGKDINNGNRLVSFQNAYDDTADKVYSGTNQSGNFTDSILWEILNPIQQTINIDDRTDSNDRIPLSFVGYLQNITEYAPQLVGLGTESTVLKLTPDLFITETNRATVDAYTEIDTPQKFYDRLKSYLVSNFVGQALYASRSGNLIDLGAYDLTIDATASAALSITGNLITIKASTFTGNINTTGTFTLSNGAVLDGVLNGVLNVSNGDVLTEDIDGTFVVDTNSVTSFTIDGFIPTNIQTTGAGSTTILGINNAKLTTTNITGTGTLVRGDGLNPSANWSYSSATSTLTLNGTEADLLGLRGLAQVDYADAGGKTVFTVNSLTKIVISSTGDLTIDSDVEQLVCGVTPASHVNTLTIIGDGRLQVGKAKVVGGFTIYSGGPAIVFSNDSSNPNFTVTHEWANLIVENGGRLDWYGGEIQTVGEIGTLAGSIIRTYSKEAMFVSVPSSLQVSRPEAYLRQDTDNIQVNGFTNKFGIYLSVGKPALFKGYEPISSGSAIDMSNQSTRSSYYDYEDLVVGKGNTRDIGGKSETWLRLLNTNLGSDITVTAQQSSAGSDQQYLVENRKGVTFSYTDETGAIVEGANIYCKDTDHGSRLAANLVGPNASYESDIEYTGTSDASGLIDFSSISNSILLSVHYHPNESGSLVYDIFDSRGINNDTSDLFTFNSISYLHNVDSSTVELKGNGTLGLNRVLITDSLISETNQSIVDAYSELEVSTKVYDKAKSYLCTNYAGETNTIVGRNGNIVLAGTYDVIFDATAGQVFDVTGNTITIKTTTFVGDINTSGTVTAINGATFDGVVNQIIDVQNGATYTEDIDGTFVVDTDSVSTFTIDGFIPSNIEHIGSGTSTILGINNAKLVGTNVTATGGTLVLGDGLNPSTNWVESGSNPRVITLTNATTETDLLGLRGLDFVDYTTNGAFNTYTFDANTRLQIDGDLQVDPAIEKIVFLRDSQNNTTNNPLIVNGILRLGKQTTENSISVFSQGSVLEFLGAINNFWSHFGMYVSNTGTLIWDGGTIRTRNSIRIRNNATLTINKGTLLNIDDSSTPQLRLTPIDVSGGSNMNVYDLLLDGLTQPARFFSTYGWNNAIFELKRGQFQTYNGTHPEQTLLNFNNIVNVNESDIESTQIQNQRCEDIIVQNPAKELTVDRNGSNTAIYLKTQRQLQLTPEDLNGVSISTYSYYAEDIDSTVRGVGPMNATDGSQDDTATKVYSGQDVTGDINDNLLIYLYYGLVGVTYTGGGSLPEYDKRMNANDAIPINIISYDRSITTWNSSLYGIGTLTESVPMTPDLLITESNRATVDAYSEISTAQEFYDYSKSYLCSNYLGEANTIVSRNGNIVLAGTYDITFDATAGQVFDVTGNTITIKSTTFTGELITTGTVQLLNGATIDGAYTDQNGTVRIVEVKATITDTSTAPIENANVLIAQSTPQATSGITRSGSTASLTITAHGCSIGDTILIKGADQGEYNRLHTITAAPDANTIEYTVSGTPTTPATGTITLQKVYLNGLTNSSGVISDSVNYVSDQAVTVVVRKSSTAPYYKAVSQSSTLTASGIDYQTSMISDQ